MSRTPPHQRVFALVLALLLFATAVAGGIIVVWQVLQDNKARQANQTALDSIASSTATPSATSQANNNEGGKTLQGTQLENFTPVSTVDSLQKTDIKEGTGEEVKPGATVTAHYTGAVAATGVIFQSSHDSGQPIPFSLTGVIKGWTDGVPGMKVGGIRRLLIPADQAYGANPPSGSGIPANAPLVFDVEVTAVQQ